MYQTDIQQLADLRGRVLRSEPVTPEEYAIVLDSIRKKRSEGAAKKAAVPAINVTGLLDQLIKSTS